MSLSYTCLKPLHLSLIPASNRLEALLRHRGIEVPQDFLNPTKDHTYACLLYTSDAADD